MRALMSAITVHRLPRSSRTLRIHTGRCLASPDAQKRAEAEDGVGQLFGLR